MREFIKKRYSLSNIALTEGEDEILEGLFQHLIKMESSLQKYNFQEVKPVTVFHSGEIK